MSEADSLAEAVLNETADILLNETASQNATKFEATTEGMCLAYGSLFLMAIIPIWIGSFRSVRFLRNAEKPEAITSRDAMMFPVIASGVLLGIYIVLKILRKDLINLLLGIYFCGLGVVALTHTLAPSLSRFWPRNAVRYSLTVTHLKQQPNEKNEGDVKTKPEEKWTIQFVKNAKPTTEAELSKGGASVYFAVEFTHYDMIVFAASCVVCGWYSVQKHWLANNLIGLAFAVNAIELLQLNTVKTGAILLGGLFFYDVFWVFGTDVMVSVAKSFDAPIKLVFPQDIIERGVFDANNFAMLGLGDIVIPGIFVALLLRFDASQSDNGDKTASHQKSGDQKTHSPAQRTYFLAGYVAYILGLALTIAVMQWFKHAQPALLYLVPSCLGLPLIVALFKGDLKRLFSYADAPEPAQPATTDAQLASTKKVD